MSALRPYQIRAIESVRAAWRMGKRRILLVSPTGSGKTTLGCAVLESAVKKGRRFLWLTHRRELVQQTSDRLDSIGVEHGIILAGKTRNTSAPILVASVQTLDAIGEAPDGIDGIVIDEAHHATAGTYRTIVSVYPQLELLLGLTATPERGDQSPLGDVFEHLITACTVRELQGLGALVGVDVFSPSRYLDGLSAQPVEAYKRLLDGKRCIVFAASVAHAEQLAAEFRAAGIPAANVDGTTNKRDRAEALVALAEGRIRVLTNVFCFTEGADIPSIEGVIIARGCAAWSTWIQMVGRGLRPSPATGKTRCTVIDLRGIVHVHGLPDDEREFSLTGRASCELAKLPALAYCRACGATYRHGPACCPRCGEVAPSRPAPRIERAELRDTKHVRIASHQEKRAYFEQLCREAKERGYKSGWVGVRFRARFGFWPVGLRIGREVA